MNVIIKRINNDEFYINIELYYTIAYLKEKIEEEIKINKLSQRLLYKGSPLLDYKTIKEYNINDNSIIHLIQAIY
jgi:hypothetical protein